jgi:hypothetical protein
MFYQKKVTSLESQLEFTQKRTHGFVISPVVSPLPHSMRNDQICAQQNRKVVRHSGLGHPGLFLNHLRTDTI